eukprot:11202833-Lingulodinium_polyedra.AAC.1
MLPWRDEGRTSRRPPGGNIDTFLSEAIVHGKTAMLDKPIMLEELFDRLSRCSRARFVADFGFESENVGWRVHGAR